MAQKDDLHEIVQLVTDEATAMTEAQFGAFFYNLNRRDGEAYALYAISGAPLSAFEGFPMARKTGIFRATFEGSGTVRLDDVLADPRYGRDPPDSGMALGRLPVHSYLAVTVFAPDGAVLGGLVVGHEDVGVFTEDHEWAAETIATQAGIAIDKALLVASERQARAEAEARGDASVALEFVEDGVIMLDRDGFVRLWNRAAATITGIDADIVLARPLGAALPGWERIVLDVPVGEPTETVAPATLPLDTLDGREAWLSIYGVAFGDGTVYAFRDVTGQRKLESMRADVIATVSHELRTPVAAVYGAAHTLKRREIGAELSAELLDIIHSESERLARLVEEILLTSEIDSGTITLAHERIEPIAMFEALRAASGIEPSRIEIDVPADISPAAGDPEKVRQVLTNFIENARKYGAAGERSTVVLRARERGGSIRFEVADDGPGVPQHEQNRIFEKFYRLDPHMRDGIRGTGLGLYICRELVQRMQGRIGLESVDGHGATFWFELPRA